MNHTVSFPEEGIAVAIGEGATLLEAQIAAGLAANAPCGGRGECGKCAVECRRRDGADYRRVLACQTRVHGDMEVRAVGTERGMRVLVGGSGREDAADDPLTRAVRLRVKMCPRGQSASDWARLKAALDAALGPRSWVPDIAVCGDLGRRLFETKGELWAVVSGEYVLEVSSDEPRVLLAAFDLGTTTIAGYLIDGASGRTLAARGVQNPQVKYGADVIARADYALRHGVDALSDCVREAVNALIADLCAEAGESAARVCAVSLAGNTAMHHLFLGISPDSLVRAPYNPTVSEALSLSARDFGLDVHAQARLYALPVIGGFVGADTVACLLSGDWMHCGKLTLLIDIGTNGELVLGDGRRRIACSTAAGPALEGAKIACGMRAAEGAIDRVWLEDGELCWHVIGGAQARGICGSGLIDLVAALLKTGAIDGGGRLAAGERFELKGTGVFLTQKDVREVQLAKAAIAAGIRLLAEARGVGLSQIQEVDIAGAFGNCIAPESACAIGLIPAGLLDRIAMVGNAAGRGARLALTDAALWREAQALARETEFLELANLPAFQDEFVDQLAFSEDE